MKLYKDLPIFYEPQLIPDIEINKNFSPNKLLKDKEYFLKSVPGDHNDSNKIEDFLTLGDNTRTGVRELLTHSLEVSSEWSNWKFLGDDCDRTHGQEVLTKFIDEPFWNYSNVQGEVL